jgi:surface antigen
MGEDIRTTSPWGIGALAIAVLTAGCVSTAPVYRDVQPGHVATLAAPHFVSAPYSQCVPYARDRAGVDIFGNANRWWSLASDRGLDRVYAPEAGAVMVLQVNAQGTRGHVAYVQRVVSSREIIIDHANWHGRGEIAVNVPVIDVSPNNDWSQVKVFWLDTMQMGARTYPVEGFVLPTRARRDEPASNQQIALY